MDLGVTLHHSCPSAGLPPSTSPPPLGERNRQSRWTTSNIHSRTMGDHEDEIPEFPSPPHEFGGEDPIPTYDIHLIYLHTLGMIPHSQVVRICFRATRILMNL